MKYIWELVARAKSLEMRTTDLMFIPARDFSPYLELSFADLNDRRIPKVLEVNPYYRFLAVFKDYFDPDYDGDVEIRDELFNLIVHYLAELDTYMGMTKREYEINFVIADIERGAYGEGVEEGFGLFALLEKKVVADNLLRLHTLSEGVFLFQDAVRKLYLRSTVYGNLTDRDVVLVHLLVEESREHRERIRVLESLFLPYHYEVEIYWVHLFGIIGIDGAMRVGEVVLY